MSLGYTTEQEGFVKVQGLDRPRSNYVDSLYYISFEEIDEEFKTWHCLFWQN